MIALASQKVEYSLAGTGRSLPAPSRHKPFLDGDIEARHGHSKAICSVEPHTSQADTPYAQPGMVVDLHLNAGRSAFTALLKRAADKESSCLTLGPRLCRCCYGRSGHKSGNHVEFYGVEYR